MTTPRDAPPGQQFGGDLLTEIFNNSMDPGYAAAAEKGRRHTPLGVAGRVLALAAIGFLLAVAYLKVVADSPATTQAREKLVSDIRRDQATADKLESDAEKLRDEVSGMRDQAVRDAGGDAKYLRDLEAVTGLGRVRGDGIVVTVGDAESAKDPVTGKPKAENSDGKIYDRDLQKIVNALWYAGAEAVTINNQRISGKTTIRAAGGAILVDFRPVDGPYRIAAIGPGGMRKAFDNTPVARQFRALAGKYGLSFGVKDSSRMTFAAAGDPQLRLAEPVPSPSPSPSPSTTPSGGGR
ncbi:DUF881 domain-containing protein [Longispora sp. K20-0274]|uniref:DUF881 domain-containing protein n=1 Tax=Longispora sp. K20-0274 TaxID=3088255 RepID=UPI00399B4FF1